jgi:hypothetical protein
LPDSSEFTPLPQPQPVGDIITDFQDNIDRIEFDGAFADLIITGNGTSSVTLRVLNPGEPGNGIPDYSELVATINGANASVITIDANDFLVSKMNQVVYFASSQVLPT